MREVSHVPPAASLTLKLSIVNPFLAFLVGIISHFILDTFPHMDPGNWFKPKEDGTRHLIQEGRWQERAIVAVDLLMAIAIGLWVLHTHKPISALAWAMFGSIFPDMFIEPHLRTWIRKHGWIAWFDWLHQKCHFTITSEQRILSHHWELVIFGYSLWWLVHN